MLEHIPKPGPPPGHSNQGPDLTWERVAEQAERADWHPALRELIGIKLAEQVEVPVATAETVEAPVKPDVEVPASQPMTPEKTTTTSEAIAQAFAKSQKAMYGLTSSEDFQKACLKNRIDPFDDMDKIGYWQTMAEYTATLAPRHTGDNQQAALEYSTLRLLASAPQMLMERRSLSQGRRDHESEIHSKEIVSLYNDLLRTFASTYPEARASDITKGLLNMVNFSIEDKNVKQSAANEVRAVVRGAQHELAFGQILTKAGIDHRPANLQEDLKGIDYVINEGTVATMAIDVKSSLHEVNDKPAVQGRGAKELSSDDTVEMYETPSTDAYKIAYDGQLVMYSLIRDQELGDKFYISDKVAEQKAGAVVVLLDQARVERDQKLQAYRDRRHAVNSRYGSNGRRTA